MLSPGKEMAKIRNNVYAADNANGYIFTADEAFFFESRSNIYCFRCYSCASCISSGNRKQYAKLGLSVSSDSVVTYITKRGTLTSTNAIQRIMEEKSAANFFSPEIWTDWRRTGCPAINVLTTAQGAPANIKEIPRGFLYSLSEMTANPTHVPSAILTDRVWWDTK